MDSVALKDLVADWLAGFCVSRRMTMRFDGTVAIVDVESASRRLEYFVVEPTAELVAETAERVAGRQDVWLTSFASARRTFDLPDGVRLRDDDETLMTTSLMRPPAARPDGVEVEDDGDRALVRLRDGGELAAEGQVAVVGERATYDRIRTHEGHQRRGHGTAVMGALTAWAMDHGARSGILAASTDGQALYGRLGWSSVALMTTWGGVSPS